MYTIDKHRLDQAHFLSGISVFRFDSERKKGKGKKGKSTERRSNQEEIPHFLPLPLPPSKPTALVPSSLISHVHATSSHRQLVLSSFSCCPSLDQASSSPSRHRLRTYFSSFVHLRRALSMPWAFDLACLSVLHHPSSSLSYSQPSLPDSSTVVSVQSKMAQAVPSPSLWPPLPFLLPSS